MISLPSDKVEIIVQALSRLAHNSDFQCVFKEWFWASYEQQKVKNIFMKGEDAIRGQGYAEALWDMVVPMKDPDIFVNKMKQLKKKHEEDQAIEW